jgi:hypothetical protein
VTPDFHDGYLDGLFVSGKTARIFLRTLAGQTYTLILREVERLHAENFLEGNIVFDVKFLQPEQLTREDVLEVYGYSEQSLVMQDWIRDATQRGLHAVAISSSYGCSVLGLFKHYELLQDYASLSGDRLRASE